VRELKNIEGDTKKFCSSGKVESKLFKVSFDIADTERNFVLTIGNDNNEKVVVSFDRGVLSFDRRNSGVATFHSGFAAVHHVRNEIVPRKLEVYVDVASVEVFVNDGECVLTEIVFPTKAYDQIVLEKPDAKFNVTALSSIWK
jgi:fructan beta-fructosidase